MNWLFRSLLGLSLLTLLLAIVASLPVAIPVSGTLAPALLSLTGAIVAFAVIPLLVVKYVYKEGLAEYGWRLPEKTRQAVILTLRVLGAHLVAAVFLAGIPDFLALYAQPKENLIPLFILGTLLSAVYFAAEEFLFRGFLVNTLWNKYKYVGVAASVILFALLHFGKTPLEIPVALISGASLAWLALKTKSFIPAAFVHWAFALALNVLVNFVYT